MSLDLTDIMLLIVKWIERLIPLGIGMITVVIFWNGAQFVLKAGDDAEREKYKQFLVWSVISMFLLVSFWGLAGFLIKSIFGSTTALVLDDPTYVDKDGNPI